MKFFLKKILKITIYFNLIYFGFIVLIGQVFSNKNPINNNLNKEILILGDSHTETALNDSIIAHSLNMAQSTEVYLYSFVKLRKFVKKNKIKKVILSVSTHNIINNVEKWYKEDENISFKLPNYYYLMSVKELFLLFKLNPIQFLKSYYAILYIKGKKVLQLNKNTPISSLEIGYFRELKGNNIAKDTLNRIEKTKQLNSKISNLQLKYLNKIAQLCTENNIQLIFINTPIFKGDTKENLRFLNNYCQNYFSNIKMLNYSSFSLNDTLFYDKDHLNKKGSFIFSDEINTVLKTN